MRTATLDALLLADDPLHFECPPGFDRATASARVAALREPLQELTGYPVQQESGLAGAPFFAELAARDPLPQRRPGLGLVIETFLTVRFSAFGHFFAVGSTSNVWPLTDEMRARVVEFVCAHGYVHVPDALLAQPHPRCRLWWYRYFDRL